MCGTEAIYTQYFGYLVITCLQLMIQNIYLVLLHEIKMHWIFKKKGPLQAMYAHIWKLEFEGNEPIEHTLMGPFLADGE